MKWILIVMTLLVGGLSFNIKREVEAEDFDTDVGELPPEDDDYIYSSQEEAGNRGDDSGGQAGEDERVDVIWGSDHVDLEDDTSAHNDGAYSYDLDDPRVKEVDDVY